MATAVRTRRLDAARDGREVARLHREALPQGFLSRLGDPFLARLYHGIDRDPRAAVWVAEDDEGVLGFLAGAADVQGLYRGVLARDALALGLRLLPSLLRPAMLRRIGETALYPFRRLGPDDGLAGLPHAELLAVGVDARARGKGVGRALVGELEEALRGWGVRAYRVVTDAEDPRSNAFYRRVGFDHAGNFTHHGHPMAAYTKGCA